jgi:hypothetical protein
VIVHRRERGYDRLRRGRRCAAATCRGGACSKADERRAHSAAAGARARRGRQAHRLRHQATRSPDDGAYRVPRRGDRVCCRPCTQHHYARAPGGVIASKSPAVAGLPHRPTRRALARWVCPVRDKRVGQRSSSLRQRDGPRGRHAALAPRGDANRSQIPFGTRLASRPLRQRAGVRPRRIPSFAPAVLQ